MIAPLAPSSIHFMASITILFRRSVPVLHRSPCSRSRCVSLSFLPLPCVRLSPLRSPHPFSKIASSLDAFPSFVYLCSMVFWYGLCFPPEGFGSVFPSFPHCFFPFLASDLSTLVLLLPIHPQVIRLFPALFSEHGSTVPTLRISCCGPRVCRSAPTPLPRSGKVNRASGGK